MERVIYEGVGNILRLDDGTNGRVYQPVTSSDKYFELTDNFRITLLAGYTYKHSVASNFEVDDYRRKQTRKAGPFLILPFGF